MKLCSLFLRCSSKEDTPSGFMEAESSSQPLLDARSIGLSYLKTRCKSLNIKIFQVNSHLADKAKQNIHPLAELSVHRVDLHTFVDRLDINYMTYKRRHLGLAMAESCLSAVEYVQIAVENTACALHKLGDEKNIFRDLNFLIKHLNSTPMSGKWINIYCFVKYSGG